MTVYGVYAVHAVPMSCICSINIGLQTDCMGAVLAPVVEAARLPHACPMAPGYRLRPL